MSHCGGTQKLLLAMHANFCFSNCNKFLSSPYLTPTTSSLGRFGIELTGLRSKISSDPVALEG